MLSRKLLIGARLWLVSVMQLATVARQANMSHAVNALRNTATDEGREVLERPFSESFAVMIIATRDCALFASSRLRCRKGLSRAHLSAVHGTILAILLPTETVFL